MKSHAAQAVTDHANPTLDSAGFRIRSRKRKHRRTAAVRHSAERRSSTLTVKQLGWTEEVARDVRAQLAAFAEDWDDPAMDVYDES